MSDIPSAPIADFMQQDLETVSEKTTSIEAASLMTTQRIGCLMVHGESPDTEQQAIIGLVSETDLVRKVMKFGETLSSTPVNQIMTSPLHTIESNRSMLDASHFMEQHGVRHLCVSEGEEIVGLISIRDLVRHFVYADSGPIRDLDNVYRPLSVLMRTNIETISGDDTIFTAVTRMTDKQIGALLVTEDTEMIGIVTERDLIQKAMVHDKDLTEVPVSAIMNRPLIGIDINRTVHDASDLMAEKWIRHLPVTENDKIVGILSVRDLIRMIALRDRPRYLRQQ
ncbi:MAG: cyclic nucleotide-binding/CBS domain-containing protein [Nitrospirales bacterium]